MFGDFWYISSYFKVGIYLYVCRYLIEKGANVAAVNNDGELACDISEGDDMEELLFNEMESKG